MRKALALAVVAVVACGLVAGCSSPVGTPAAPDRRGERGDAAREAAAYDVWRDEAVRAALKDSQDPDIQRKLQETALPGQPPEAAAPVEPAPTPAALVAPETSAAPVTPPPPETPTTETGTPETPAPETPATPEPEGETKSPESPAGESTPAEGTAPAAEAENKPAESADE